jgi:hypothetical protein
MEFREKPHTDKYKEITNGSNYFASCTPTSPPVWDLEYFDRLIFVAQCVQEAGWAPEPVWTQRLEEKSFRLCRGSNLDRPVVHPVARHYTD